MKDLNAIRRPVEAELERYSRMFQETLTHEDSLLGQALAHIRQRRGKMMRPLLVLLVAKEFGTVGTTAVRSAVALELLHTASLVHDDVVDDSSERRGQAAEHALFGNKVAILVGDYMLSKCLQQAALTGDVRIVDIIARLGGTLSEGEVRQLANIRTAGCSEDTYFSIIRNKTAALFEACARLGALSSGATPEVADAAARLGEIIGICFQIRDDIFDYYADTRIGKPTGNDMTEGKLTLPAIYAANGTDREDVLRWVQHVKTRTATQEEIGYLVNFTKQTGGIDYARTVMERYREEALPLIATFRNAEVRTALKGYLDYTIGREH
ncbi:MAG: polyprenyl synthetase family protein [Alloprevotella sp.]|nr:polyprenyl synthetase family protein [Alloprevotella sp.]